MNIIIEGIDHVGKDSVINELMQLYPGYIIHSQKPVLIKKFVNQVNDNNYALYMYQKKYFGNIFYNMRFTDTREFNVYYNRFHLGEYVYGKLYRNYSNQRAINVFKHEKHVLDKNNTVLALLVKHKVDFRANDPEAFSFENGEIEQKLFFEAFNYSQLKKGIFYVDNENGDWNSPLSIAKQIESTLLK